MDVELHEIRGFLAEHEPFSGLPPTILDELPARLQLRYYRRGTVLLQIGRSNDRLHILRSATANTPRLHRNLAAKALCQHLETSLHRPPLR